MELIMTMIFGGIVIIVLLIGWIAYLDIKNKHIIPALVILILFTMLYSIWLNSL